MAPAWALALTFSADMQKDYFVWSVAAHGLAPDRKRIIFWRLPDGADEEGLTFDPATSRDYLQQIASERLEKDKNGRETWKRVRENHCLDCLVGHMALAYWQWAPSLAQLSGMNTHRETVHENAE